MTQGIQETNIPSPPRLKQDKTKENLNKPNHSKKFTKVSGQQLRLGPQKGNKIPSRFWTKKNLIIERNDVPGLPNPKTNTKDLFTKPSYAFCPQKNHVIPIENL